MKRLAALYPNKTYTLSAYVKLDTAASSGGIRLAFLKESGDAIEGASSPLLTTSTKNVNGGWQRLTVTYTPTTSLAARASVISTGFSGTAYVDCIQLEEEDAASTYNLVEEGSFEHINLIPVVSGNIFGWYYSGNASIRSNDSGNTNSANTNFGTHGVRINGGSGMQRIGQEIKINAPAGTTFLLSGWGKANALPDSVAEKTTDTQAYFGLIARLYYADNTSDVYYFPFDAYYSDWQQKGGIIVPKKGNQDKAITHAVVVASYDNNINTAWFDNISLRMEPAQSYEYNEDGKPIVSSQTGTGTQEAKYTGVDLTSYTAPNGNKSTYTYNTKHDVLSATSGGVTSTYTYDSSGNLLTTKQKGTDANYLSGSATMTADRNHTQSATDVNGNTVSYTYDDYFGTVESATQRKDASTTVRTEYDYQAKNGRLLQTRQDGVAEVYYDYANGSLASLQRKTFRDGAALWQKYAFTKNEWGQTEKITVSGGTSQDAYSSPRTLASYEYADNNGTLTSMTYGNGDSVSYTYDEFDRVVEQRYNSGRYITYSYDAIGALSAMTYGDGSEESGSYVFEYDSLGRLLRSSEYDGNGTLVQQTEHGYDEYGRLQAQYWTIGTTSYSEKYSYNDGENGNGSLKDMTAATGDKLGFTYDKLNRLQRTTVTDADGAAILNTAYAYRTVSGNQTSAQVAFRNVRLGSSTGSTPIEGKKYSYDGMGNITLISQSTGSYYPLVAYEYDSQNQLIKETYYDGKGTGSAHVTDTYEYTYDTAGNILSEKKNGTTTKTYTYGNSQWKDLLTSVAFGSSNYACSYDAIGNPTSYCNGVNLYSGMTWENGRRLTELSVDSGDDIYSIGYTYDSEGIRTGKTIESRSGVEVSHRYITQNGKVVRETIGTGSNAKVLDFIYDESGKPFALKYSTNGGRSFKTYYYILNLQGDVVKLVEILASSAGTEWYSEKANYTYDAWGNILSVTDERGDAITDSTHLAHLNPLRYRGYYYDVETQFYYLQSRYYDPATHRFINADAPEYSTMSAYGLNNSNLFAYCQNNPIVYGDENGKWLHILIGAVVGAVVNTVSAVVQGEPIDEVIVSGVCGAVSGGLSAAGFGAAAGAVTSFVDSAYGNIKDVISGEATIGEAILGTVVDTAVGAGFGAVGSSSAADVAKSTRISNAGWNGLKTLWSNSARSAAKKAAKVALESAGKYAAKTLASDFITSSISTGTSMGISWYTGKAYAHYTAMCS